MMKLLAVVVALAVPPAIYFTTLGAKRERDVAAAHEQLAQLDIRIATLKPAHHTTPRVLPPAPAIEEIHSLTQSIADANGVRLTRFDPGQPTTGNAVQQQTMIAEVVGSAEATAEFLRRITNASNLVDVSGVTVAKDGGGWRTEFRMTTYASR